MTVNEEAALAAIGRVRAQHTKHEVILCGAMAEVPHRHGSEREPYPIRPVTCTELQDHKGPHRDATCCWNFQRFNTHATYKSAEWADRSICSHCHTNWPCPTIQALDGAPEPEDVWEYGVQYLPPSVIAGEPVKCGSERAARLAVRGSSEPARLLRRRPKVVHPAGPWLPVEGEKP